MIFRENHMEFDINFGSPVAVLGFPLSPWLVVRQKRILRDRASVRQGNVPAGPVLRLKDGDTTPRPGAPGQGGQNKIFRNGL